MMTTSAPQPRRNRPWLVTGVLLGPVAVLTVLIAAIAYKGPGGLFAPPVGAGAGRTGGANAIGELLSGRPADYNAHASAPAPAGTDPGPKEVDPESLPQGFILVVEDKARLATQTSPIFIASNLYNNWNPGDRSMMLTPQSDMRWRIELPQPVQWREGKRGPKLEFKFARGSWELEELRDDMSATANRTLGKIDVSGLAPGEKPTIELSVSKWGDQRPEYRMKGLADPYAPIAARGDVRRLEVVGGAGGAEGLTREVLVWLPPGYDAPENASRVYPVLYLHDGQNVFSKPAGVPGEWGADETATKLIAGQTVEPFIVVGIPNSGASRISEYLPAAALPDVAAAGGAYAEWFVGQVKPRIERAFRVARERERVTVGGSSLGAAISMHLALEYPGQFGNVLAESLPLTTGDASAWSGWIEGLLSRKGEKPIRVYLGVGGREFGEARAERSAALVKSIEKLSSDLVGAGVPAKGVKLVVEDGAEHTESAWAGRLPGALEFLLSK